jgi:hypothetical protein
LGCKSSRAHRDHKTRKLVSIRPLAFSTLRTVAFA